jgi:two-component system response regulator AtoC
MLTWQGNVRELANSIVRYVLVGPETAFGQEASARRSPVEVRSVGSARSAQLKGIAKQAIRQLERRVIWETLQANRWNRRKTAQVLGISYRSLIYKIRDAGLPSRRAATNSSNSSDPVGDPRDV